MRSHLVAGLVFVIAWSLEGHAQVLLLHDGFEAPSIAGHALNVSGPFTFGAWSGVAGSLGGNAGIVRGADNGLAPAEGVQHFAFNGGNPPAGGYIETSLFAGAGSALRLSFALGRSGAVGQLLHAKIEVFDVSSGQHLLEEIAIPDQVIGYTSFGFDFTATGAMRLRFTDVSANNVVSDLWLDNVTVTLIGGQTPDGGGSLSAVPEPADWAEFAGFGVLGYSALKRRRRTGIGNWLLGIRERLTRFFRRSRVGA